MLKWKRTLHTVIVMDLEEERRQTSVVVKVTERPGLMIPLSCEKLFTFYRVHVMFYCKTQKFLQKILTAVNCVQMMMKNRKRYKKVAKK